MSKKAWAGRFKKPIDDRVIKFHASLAFDYALYPYDIIGSMAHVKMLAKQKLITDDDAKKISDGLSEILQELNNGEHELDISCEDIHMFIESLLIKKIGDVGKKLHTARSRNDQVALDLRLYAKDNAKQIEQLLDELIAALSHFEDLYAKNMMPGYTHLQQAQPISLGLYFGAYKNMFSRDKDRFIDWKKRMNYSPLGAGALAGSKLPLDRDFTAKELGFAGIIDNSLDAVSDRDFVIEFCNNAAIVMMHLSRLAEDIIIWSSSEFNFAILDDAFATGSSLMPNKKNPDVLELIRGKSGRTYGNLMSILTVMKAMPLAYNKDMQEDKESMFDSCKTLVSCLTIITPFLQSLQFNLEHMDKMAQQDGLQATSILEKLVLKGVPFREAHHKVGEWVLQAEENNLSLKDVIDKDLL